MVLAMISIRLVQCFIPSYPSNRVFHYNPSPRERTIEGDVLGRTVFAARFAAWRHAQALRMQLVDTDIRQIAPSTYTLPQTLHDARLFEGLDVRVRPWHTISYITDLARLFVHYNLALQRSLLLFATVVLIGYLAIAMALYSLLKGINQHDQVGRFSQ